MIVMMLIMMMLIVMIMMIVMMMIMVMMIMMMMLMMMMMMIVLLMLMAKFPFFPSASPIPLSAPLFRPFFYPILGPDWQSLPFYKTNKMAENSNYMSHPNLELNSTHETQLFDILKAVGMREKKSEILGNFLILFVVLFRFVLFRFVFMCFV
jgi:hypothetical protein